jgi:hypothetical protein
VTSPAGGPGRQPEGGRPPDSASFETARLGGRRPARPPIVASAFVLVLGLVAAAGVGGRLGAGAFPLGGENIALASADPTPVETVASFAPPTPMIGPAFPEDTGPIYTSAPGPMQVQAKRHPTTIFVHGDIDAERITWVYVGVLDDSGRVAGWTSVSLPGAAGPNTVGGPNVRFDVELAIPADVQGRLWVRALAYDANGKLAASTSVEIPVAG